MPGLSDSAVINGHLARAPAGDTVRVAYLGHYARQQVATRVDPKGNFSVTVRGLKTGTPARITYAGQQTTLFLSPGDELTLSVDFLRFDESLTYTGRGANANNYLARSLWAFEYSPSGALPRPRDTQTVAYTAAQMRQCADAYRKKRRRFLADWDRTHALPTAFAAAAATHIDLQWVLALLEYPVLHNRLKRRLVPLPASYYRFLAEIAPHTLDPYPLRDRGSDDNGLVFNCLYTYGFRLVPNGKLRNNTAEAKQLYAQAKTELGLTAADAAVFLLLDEQSKTNWEGMQALYHTYCVQNRDSVRGRELRQLVGQRHLLQTASQLPAITLPDHTGKPVSLQDFRGKVIYLDFWGTWCKPCLAELPATRALQRHFANRDVVFVSIDVSDSPDKWLSKLASEHLVGAGSVHLRSPDLKVPSLLGVASYPTYFIIGRDGRLERREAPRPSSTQAIITALEKALAAVAK